ncbi:MAG TPA: alpha/beta fold hydrolase [Pyrinomonadaceae bacterium]|jgi:poly(3-hydroxybutyrate) depolymerase|nr:alpha/beta fold hydrolase [Pyrinomonadaceae bacterium]
MNGKKLTLVSLALLLLSINAHAAGKISAEKILKEKFDSPQGKRTYYLFVPDSVKTGTQAPLLVLLHGSGRNGLSLAEKWKETASREGLILVAPDASNAQGWRTPEDGPEFIHDLVETLRTKYPINARRVYLFGHSAGAVFAINLAMLESEYFAATAVHAGAWREASEFSLVEYAKRKTPVAIFVGDRDAFFPMNAVKATEAALRGRGFPVEVTLMKGHDHWYYDLAPEINRNAWDFLKQHGLSEDPKHTEYNRAAGTDDANRAVTAVNALRGKAEELLRRFYAKEEELNRNGFTKDRAALAEIVRAQTALLAESANALREAAAKTEAIGKLKLAGNYPQYFAIVAQVDRKRLEALDALRERTELLLSDEPANTVTTKRNEATSRAQRLNEEADELQQKAERVRAGQEK